jgi:triosephosphate isomerase
VSTRRKIFIGNWKMNKLPQDAVAFCETFVPAVRAVTESGTADIGLAAASLLLPAVSKQFSSIRWYAQNCHWAESGAYTGEVSTAMLKSVEVCGSLVAHSERRQMCGETNQTAGQRAAALLAAGLQAVLCVGETLAERDSGRWEAVLESQLSEAFSAMGMSSSQTFSQLLMGPDWGRPLLTIAYEPVWAIGTGRAATPAQAQEAHAFIRGWLSRTLGTEVGSHLRLQYGGSVTLQNVEELMSLPDIDGALVGGASLKAADFAELCVRGSRVNSR